MSEVTVLVARRAVATRLQAILRDWASLKLIDPVLVVDIDSRHAQDQQIPATVINDTGAVVRVLQQELSQGDVTMVRVCVVSFLGDEQGRSRLATRPLSSKRCSPRRPRRGRCERRSWLARKGTTGPGR